MTDFYSVLKSSIVQRNLRSPGARNDVYEQAREAMIRRLWSLQPPLSADEIDARIGLFDDAVEKIEEDLAQSFATVDDVDRRRSRPHDQRRASAGGQARLPPVYDTRPADRGYAEDAEPYGVRYESKSPQPPTRFRARNDDTAPNGGRPRVRGEPSRDSREAAYDEQAVALPMRGRPDDDWHVAEARSQRQPPDRQYGRHRRVRDEVPYEPYEEPAYNEEVAGEFENGDLRHLPAVVDVTAPATGYDDAYRSNGYDEAEYQDDAYRQPRYEEAAYVEYEVEEPGDPYETAPRMRHARRYEDDPAASDAYVEEFEAPTGRRRPAARRSAKASQAKGGKRTRRPGRRSVPVLAITIGALAVFLIAFNLYVFLPLVLGSNTSRSTVANTPTKVEDRLPTLEQARTGPAAIASSSATAVEIPERNLDVAESLVIFNGSDPTVFEGTSNNPILFDSDSEGGFARISSAASAAGARAIIGPGLADRLAGRTVRVTLLARSSNENGAAKMRFAYQSGLAVSHWQSADLSSSYGAYGMIWRVPAADTSDLGYLLIEPGIPGDGTSTDIRMIKIDILTS